MLKPEEKSFIEYWSVNRLKKKKSVRQFTIGLPMGVLIVLALFANIISGWHKQASMQMQNNGSLFITIIVAAIAIVIFITLFSIRHQWEQNEQRYNELLLKQSKEAASL
jgi:H+/gluconate symporter-like permease